MQILYFYLNYLHFKRIFLHFKNTLFYQILKYSKDDGVSIAKYPNIAYNDYANGYKATAMWFKP